MKKIIYFVIAAVLALGAQTVSAHVVVKPTKVGVGTFQTFSVGVPVEKNNATVKVRLVLPDGLKHVTPNVKHGWTIETVKAGQGEAAVVKEIIWKWGAIPAGQRDDFMFSAQVPAEAGTLQWKAYQTYLDGTVVAWEKSTADQPKDVSGAPDFSKFGPYSETTIINDLAPVNAESKKNETQFAPLTVSVLALIISLLALNFAVRRVKFGEIPEHLRK